MIIVTMRKKRSDVAREARALMKLRKMILSVDVECFLLGNIAKNVSKVLLNFLSLKIK